MAEIEVWETYERPHEIRQNVLDNDFRIRIDDTTSTLPDRLVERVDELWNEADMPYEDNILFLTGIQRMNGDTTIETNVRPFRFTYAFNRTEELYNEQEAVNTHKLLSISTHAHLLSNDQQLLYAPKINQMGQISGFSGFPNVDEHSVDVNGERYLDIYTTIQDKVGGEVPEDMRAAIQSIKAVGITFADIPGLRGTDSDYVIELDMNADDAVRAFEDHYRNFDGSNEQQFAPELHTVRMEPRDMADFIRYANSEDRSMSRYAMGCMYALTRCMADKDKAETIRQTIQDDVGVAIDSGNTGTKQLYLA